MAGAAVAVLTVVWGGLSMPPLAVVLAVIANLTGPWWFRLRIAAYKRRVNEQVAGVARSLAGRVRAVLPLNRAILDVCEGASQPLGGHLRELVRHIAQTFTVFTLGKDSYPEAKADVDAVVGGRRVTFGGKLPVPAR